MTKLFTLLAACTLLVACGDPLAKVDKLSSLDLADDAITVGALPDPASAAETTGLFSGLFSRRQAEPVSARPSTEVAVNEALSEAGASPSADAETRAAVPAQVAIAAAPGAPERRGIFGFLRGKEASAAPVQQAVAAAPELAAPETASPRIEQAILVEADKALAVTEAVPTAVAKPRRGLFGLLAGARAKDQAASASASVRTASLGPVAQPPQNTEKPALFSRAQSNHNGPDAQIVPFGTVLSSGVVARVCDLPRGRLGKEVGKFPERGRGYKMFDSNSGGSGPRPFYVTGFGDDCARTFTAALALFGSPTMHEQLRYGLPSSVQPYSTTDKAYEGIKKSICGAPRKKACGAKIGLLEKNTAFISIYDRIGSNSKWSNLLLHKGWVLAVDRKG